MKEKEYRLKTLFWEATLRCNAFCEFCGSRCGEVSCNEIFKIIQKISAEGTTVLLVEQNAKKALAIADRAYVLETGKIALSGDAKELMNNESIKKAYLGE